MRMKPSDLPPELRERLGLDKPRSKYNVSSKDTRTCDGIVFDSKAEMHYYRDLCLKVKAGIVAYFLRQVPFHLPGGVVYRCDFAVFYWPDAVLVGGQVVPNNALRVEYIDVKGCRTREFINKKKQVESLYPVKIREVSQ